MTWRDAAAPPPPHGTPHEPLDGVTLLTVFVVALVAVQSRLVVSALGGVGQPAQLVAMVALLWWIFHHAQRPAASGNGVQPVRLVLAAVVAAFAVSYVAAMSRPIDPAESSTANIGIVTLLGWAGVLLMTNDGIPSILRLDQLIRRVVVAGTLLALLAIAQFVTGQDLLRDVVLPGLSVNNSTGDLLNRSGFTRPSGTALHPIELGAVLTMVLPLSISCARLGGGRLGLAAWACPVSIGLAIVLSSSRSALLCAAVVMLVLGFGWSARERLWTALGVLVGLAGVAVLIPSFLGSLLKLFLRAGSDPSIDSRTGSYDLVGQLFNRDPVFGRGFRTLLPSYRILDNQYLGLLVEVGMVGLLAFLALLGTAGWVAVRARRATEDRVVGEHAQALLASVAAAAVGLVTFDGLSFPMASALIFLVVGLTGATWRLVRTDRARPGVQVPATSGDASPGQPDSR